MADEKKPLELTEDELGSATGGIFDNYPASVVKALGLTATPTDITHTCGQTMYLVTAQGSPVVSLYCDACDHTETPSEDVLRKYGFA